MFLKIEPIFWQKGSVFWDACMLAGLYVQKIHVYIYIYIHTHSIYTCINRPTAHLPKRPAHVSTSCKLIGGGLGDSQGLHPDVESSFPQNCEPWPGEAPCLHHSTYSQGPKLMTLKTILIRVIRERDGFLPPKPRTACKGHSKNTHKLPRGRLSTLKDA